MNDLYILFCILKGNVNEVVLGNDIERPFVQLKIKTTTQALTPSSFDLKFFLFSYFSFFLAKSKLKLEA